MRLTSREVKPVNAAIYAGSCEPASRRRQDARVVAMKRIIKRQFPSIDPNI